MDQVIPVANLERGLRAFLARQGVAPRAVAQLRVGRMNASVRKDTRMGRASLLKVAERYAQDFVALGFPYPPGVS